jgi:hypothetical protein
LDENTSGSFIEGISLDKREGQDTGCILPTRMNEIHLFVNMYPLANKSCMQSLCSIDKRYVVIYVSFDMGYRTVSFTYTNTGHISTAYRICLPVDTYSQKDVFHSFW